MSGYTTDEDIAQGPKVSKAWEMRVSNVHLGYGDRAEVTLSCRDVEGDVTFTYSTLLGYGAETPTVGDRVRVWLLQ